MTRLVFVTLAIVVMLARPSQAQGPVAKGPPEKRAGAIDPIVAERVRDIQQSKGPEIYAALRALWPILIRSRPRSPSPPKTHRCPLPRARMPA
jgi:hypothetical protein